MGLDVSHDAFSGAYSAFSRFRMAICLATGGAIASKSPETRWTFGPGFSPETHPGLFEFLCHSDCDGQISTELAAACADEMEALLPILDEMRDAFGHIARDGGYGAVAKRWIAGCRLAAEKGEPLEFM